jgi:hypothetical protein
MRADVLIDALPPLQLSNIAEKGRSYSSIGGTGSEDYKFANSMIDNNNALQYLSDPTAAFFEGAFSGWIPNLSDTATL